METHYKFPYKIPKGEETHTLKSIKDACKGMSWKGLPNNCTKQNDKNIKCQQQQKCDFMKIYTKRDEKKHQKSQINDNHNSCEEEVPNRTVMPNSKRGMSRG